MTTQGTWESVLHVVWCCRVEDIRQNLEPSLKENQSNKLLVLSVAVLPVAMVWFVIYSRCADGMECGSISNATVIPQRGISPKPVDHLVSCFDEYAAVRAE